MRSDYERGPAVAHPPAPLEVCCGPADPGYPAPRKFLQADKASAIHAFACGPRGIHPVLATQPSTRRRYEIVQTLWSSRSGQLADYYTRFSAGFNPPARRGASGSRCLQCIELSLRLSRAYGRVRSRHLERGKGLWRRNRRKVLSFGPAGGGLAQPVLPPLPLPRRGRSPTSRPPPPIHTRTREFPSPFHLS